MAGPARALAAPEAPRADGDLEELTAVEARDALEVAEARPVDADLGGIRVRGLRLTDVVVERGTWPTSWRQSCRCGGSSSPEPPHRGPVEAGRHHRRRVLDGVAGLERLRSAAMP